MMTYLHSLRNLHQTGYELCLEHRIAQNVPVDVPWQEVLYYSDDRIQRTDVDVIIAIGRHLETFRR